MNVIVLLILNIIITIINSIYILKNLKKFLLNKNQDNLEFFK